MARTVTVACKLPNGLLLRNFRMEEINEQVMGGGTRAVNRAVLAGDPVRIHGNRAPHGEATRVPVIGGYALTPNVDADFFDAWMAANAHSDMVRDGLIFAHARKGNVEAQAKERKDQRSGLEPITPDKDPRNPRPLNPNLGRVEKADEKVA